MTREAAVRDTSLLPDVIGHAAFRADRSRARAQALRLTSRTRAPSAPTPATSALLRPANSLLDS
jgi:hypothetical protein